MHNTKKRCALLGLALCMSFGMTGCNNTNEKRDISNYLKEIDPENIGRTSYETIELEVTDYTTRYGAIASAKYEETVVRAEIPYGSATPITYLARNNQIVRKGAKLFQYRLEFDEVYMASKRLELTRKTERFEAYKTSEEERLAELLTSVSQLPAGSEALAEATKDYEKQVKEYDRQVESTQEEIDKLADEVAAFDNNGKALAVTAPEEGLFTYDYRMYWLADGTEIGRIKNPLTNIYAVANQFGYYMVGQKVTGEYNDLNGESHTVEGRVLSVDSVLPLNLASESAYIWFDFPEGMTESPTSVHAFVENVSLKNVVLIPKKLVKTYNFANYIEILTDEGITRKNIDILTEADTNYVILDTSLAGCKVIKR